MQNRIKNVVSQYAVKSFWFSLIEIKKMYDIINEILCHRIRIYLTAVSSILLAMNGIYSNHHCTSRKRRISMSVQQISLILIYSILQSRRRIILWIILYDVNGIIPSRCVPTVKNNYVQAYMYFLTYIDVKIT